MYLESFDKKSMREVVKCLGGDPTDLGSVKLLEKIMLLSGVKTNLSSLMCPFYVLYDLRVIYSHLGSSETEKMKLESIRNRLGVSLVADIFEIYEAIATQLTSSFDQFTEAL